jgi:hypothetical protein
VHGAPACVTVKVRPATVKVAVRIDDVVFAAALNATGPEPLPLAPDVTVSQAALLVAVHAHPVGAVTVTEPEPPAAVTPWLVAEIA